MGSKASNHGSWGYPKVNDMIEVYTKHCVAGVETELDLSDESSGTQKIFGLLSFIAASLLTGTALVIDELDAKLHPVLLKHVRKDAKFDKQYLEGKYGADVKTGRVYSADAVEA